MVVRIAFVGRGLARARTRLPATSSPPGRPRSRSSNASSSPLWPTGQSAGKPRAYSALRSSTVSCGSMRPAIESAIPTSGEVRASAGPCARTLPSCERRVARTAGTLTRARRSPARSSGNTSWGAQSTRSPDTRTRRSPRRLPKTRVSTTTGTVTSSPSAPSGSPASSSVSVAVAAARRYARRKRSIGKRSLDSSLSRSCIARRSPRSQASVKSPATRSPGDRVLDPTIPPATSDTAASPASAGKARWVRRRRRSEGMLFTGGGPCCGEPRSMVPAVNSLNPP